MKGRLSDEYFVRALRESDVDGPYPGWFEDPEVCRFNSHGKFQKSLESFRAYVRSLDRGEHVVWAICHDRDGHIGNISLQGISWLHRSAELAIIIGERRHWGRGVGILAGRHLLEHGFQRLNLHRIQCGTPSGNLAMCRLALSLGMTEEGRCRDTFFLEGEWHDLVLFGILHAEYLRLRA